MTTNIFVFILFSTIFNLANSAPSCRDWEGNDVDWFIAYKLPKNVLSGYKNPINDGDKVLYADSKNSNMRVRGATIDSQTNAVAHTTRRALHARFKPEQDEMYAFYNDHRPDDTRVSSDFAHAKGFLVFDKERGFWMIHSVPRFPQVSVNHYQYAQNGFEKGQIFFCATFRSDQLGEIASQIFTSRFSYYSLHFPQSMKTKWPILHAALNSRPTISDMKNLPFWRNAKLKTEGGEWLHNFQKYGYAEEDLYSNQVSQSLKLDFVVQSFFDNAPGAVNYRNTCGRRFISTTRNVYQMRYSYEQYPNQWLHLAWSTTQDHSKWAASIVPEGQGKYFKPTFCIGDINRQTSQSGRGGGAMCIVNYKIWRFFRDIVHQVECCEGETAQGCLAPDMNHSENPPLKAKNFYDSRRRVIQ